MRLVFRRARGAKGLLVAAVGAAFIATALLTGLADYSREVIAAGGRSAVESAPPDERALVARGAAGADAAENDARDSALRAAVTGGVGGRPATVSAAGYAVGRQFSGDFGGAYRTRTGMSSRPRSSSNALPTMPASPPEHGRGRAAARSR